MWCSPCRRRSAPSPYTNKALIYDLLFEVAAQTLRTIAADPKHLGAHIGVTLVLHTWGSALTHHPHVHGIVPGGGLAPDGARWVACKPGFFLPVRVLSRLFRRRFLEELATAHHNGRLQFFGEFVGLANARAFAAWLGPLRQCEWVVYAKRPFAGPAAVLAYLSRYTHRVAISNQRLMALDERGVTFRWKDYRATGKTRHKTMTLATDEFIRRFLPAGKRSVRRPHCESPHDHRHLVPQRSVHFASATADSRRFALRCRNVISRPLRHPSARPHRVTIRHRRGVTLGRPECRVPLESQRSNPHSAQASPDHTGAYRGFLPRGLSDACPRGVITSSHACACGQASDKP
jgi:Putative transposase